MPMIGGNTQPRKFKWWFDQRVPLLIKFGADPSNGILGVIAQAMRKSQLSKSRITYHGPICLKGSRCQVFRHIVVS